MLPPFIIDQIRKREQEEQAHYEQPQLELPIMPPMPKRDVPEDEPRRGVLILEL